MVYRLYVLALASSCVILGSCATKLPKTFHHTKQLYQEGVTQKLISRAAFVEGLLAASFHYPLFPEGEVFFRHMSRSVEVERASRWSQRFLERVNSCKPYGKVRRLYQITMGLDDEGTTDIDIGGDEVEAPLTDEVIYEILLPLDKRKQPEARNCAEFHVGFYVGSAIY